MAAKSQQEFIDCPIFKKDQPKNGLLRFKQFEFWHPKKKSYFDSPLEKGFFSLKIKQKQTEERVPQFKLLN